MSGSGIGVMVPKSTETQTETGFAYQRCRWCGTASFRRLLCPVCAGGDLTTEHSAGPGIVVRSRVVHRGTGVARNESLVRFPEDFVVPCRIVGTAPHLVWVGATVKAAPGTADDCGEVCFELDDPVESDGFR
ncbi:Zn-ribbon domain-containing OB-fold protein [Streptomyces beihaiensis]|uniref:Zinc ribbon domain-containing protein n=1 Tax=Streptomyces beihaiensis TaxID=2984495 RepID=A0ABT3TSP8_9ACTN|nr:zinc ribbon domain-containing protein [Streptomyces beihaiensis]MCX3060069.1 zinc ribbon domain-containing protein [Streptomyces beihaiensis]